MTLPDSGLFSAGHVAFLETITDLRPTLHRYCARMTGSSMDGEDVMQEVIFEAYRKLERFDDSRPLHSWLFGIAHNRCIDFLRRRKVRLAAEAEAATDMDYAGSKTPVGVDLGDAVERLVMHLPPKERACILLKDVLDHSLEEIAILVGSTVGGVKAALSRGRNKLAKLPCAPPSYIAPSSDITQLLQLYVERFNRRDWDGVRTLASSDARLCVADCFSGRLAESPYFIEYERPIIPWRMAVGDIDGETAIVILHDDPSRPAPWSLIRLGIRDGLVARIDDYIKCPWVLQTPRALSFS